MPGEEETADKRCCVEFRRLNQWLRDPVVPEAVLVPVVINGRRILVRALPHEVEALLRNPEAYLARQR